MVGKGKIGAPLPVAWRVCHRSGANRASLSRFSVPMKNKKIIALALLLSVLGLNAATVTFQEGVNGYTGTFDTYLRGADTVDTQHGDEIDVSADGNDGGQPIDGLIRFENIFGTGPGQVPPDRPILSAQLITRSVTGNSQSGSEYGLYRMLAPWDEASSTWNSFVGGIDVDDVEAASIADATFTPSGSVPFSVTNDVTASVQAWQAGTANYGWVINIVNGTDGFDFRSSEDTTVANHPELVITYQALLTNIVITEQPVSVTTNEGATVSFFFFATGDPRIQWYHDGTPIPDATNATLTLTGVTTADNGQYHATLDNDFPSSATTADASLTVIPDVTAPRLLIAYATSLSAVTLVFDEAVDPASVSAASVNWYTESENGTDLNFVSTATVTNGNTILLTTVPDRLTGENYHAVISGVTDVSAAANVMADTTLPMHQFATTPTIAPDTVTVWKYNDSGTDRSGEGWANIGYDDSSWADGFNGFVTPGDDVVVDPAFTLNTMTLLPPSGTHVVDYYRTHFNWSGTGSVAVVEIIGAFDDGAAFYVNGQRVGRVRLPEVITGTILATGQGAGDPVHELDAPVYGLATNLVNGDNVFAVEGHAVSTTSSDSLMAVQLRVSVPQLASGPPTIRTEPLSATINEGDMHTFAVVADGAEPLSYQWKHDGNDISGATAASFTLSNAVPSDSGDYTVHITNPAGTADSTAAHLTVLPDTNGPVFISAIAATNGTTVVLTFSEALAVAGAETAGNYTIQLTAGGGAVAVSSATLTNGTNVTLTLGSALTAGAAYTITVSGVTDLAATPNAVTPASHVLAQTIVLLAPSDPTIWRYNQTSNDLAGTGWQNVGFDDTAAGWESGVAGFGTPSDEIVPAGYELRTTNLVAHNTPGPRTAYFRTHFNVPLTPTNATLAWQGVIDDGAVFYINGAEAGRFRMLGGPGPVSFTNEASNATETSNTHPLEGPVDLDASALQAGDNVLAIELHQSGTASSDAVLSIELLAYVGASGGVTMQPRVNISRNASTGQMTISWNAAGFCLQETTALQSTGTGWAASAVVNGVAFTPTGEMKFYRLVSCP